MRYCKQCGVTIPVRKKIEGKTRNLQNRKFCLTCSPFGNHNTRDLTNNERDKNEKYRKWQRKSRKERKEKLIEMLGGKCCRCGYNKSRRSMCFHHREQDKKGFELSQFGLLRAWKVVLEEAKKCDLVCLNCHGEIHDEMNVV